MKKISWESTKGQVIEIEASYSEAIIEEGINCDGDIIKTGKKEVVPTCRLWVTVDGKFVDRCENVNFWELIDAQVKGYKRIWGIEKVLMTPEKAKEVEAFLNEVIAEGKTPEAVAIEEKEEESEKAEQLEIAREIIEEAKTTRKNRDGSLMTIAQAKEWKQNYNNVQNEGEEGFVPNIITQEAYDRALRIVNES